MNLKLLKAKKLNLSELKVVRESLQASLAKLPTPKCDNCEHLYVNRRCALFDEVPPSEVQAVGCESWQHDGIPF